MKNSIRMYGGKVTLEYHENGHGYFVGGERVPSVTTVLGVLDKPALVQWAANQAVEHYKGALKPGVALDEVELLALHEEAKYAHRRRSAKKMAAGTVVHSFVEAHVKGLRPPIPENEMARKGALAFLSWVIKSRAKFLESERPVYSREHGYAGRLDFVAMVGKGKSRRLAVCDLKTGSGVYDEHFFQLAGYAMAYAEETGKKPASLVVVNAQVDGQLFVEERDASETWPKEVFLHCLGLYRALQEGKVKP